jgi:hypothetical protein
MTLNDPMATIIPRGDNTVFDVSLRIVNIEKLQELARQGPLTFETWGQSETQLNLGNLVPGQPRFLGRFQLPQDRDKQGYSLFFSTRNRLLSPIDQTSTSKRHLEAGDEDSSISPENLPDYKKDIPTATSPSRTDRP